LNKKSNNSVGEFVKYNSNYNNIKFPSKSILVENPFANSNETISKKQSKTIIKDYLKDFCSSEYAVPNSISKSSFFDQITYNFHVH
jgi:ABC-type sulfate transport system substrate-binding protein